jgi:uncharacterized phage protein (TIGR01671 family)
MWDKTAKEYDRPDTWQKVSFPDILKCDDIVVEQYTGLHDKKGREVYEGDIVEIKNHPFQKHPGSLTGIQINGCYSINWSEYSLTWCAGNLLLNKLKPYIAVVGNIHENTDLLEEEK